MFGLLFWGSYPDRLQCYESATTVINTLVDSLIPTGYMRTSPDGHFVFASFASAFLLKVCSNVVLTIDVIVLPY